MNRKTEQMFLVLVAVLHLGAVIGSAEYGRHAQQKRSGEEILTYGAEMVLPFVILIEQLERINHTTALTRSNLRKRQEQINDSLCALFSPDQRECIQLLRQPSRSGAICDDVWFGTPEQRNDGELAKIGLQLVGARFLECVSRGLIDIDCRTY